jgi:hypothetical protein
MQSWQNLWHMWPCFHWPLGVETHSRKSYSKLLGNSIHLQKEFVKETPLISTYIGVPTLILVQEKYFLDIFSEEIEEAWTNENVKRCGQCWRFDIVDITPLLSDYASRHHQTKVTTFQQLHSML